MYQSGPPPTSPTPEELRKWRESELSIFSMHFRIPIESYTDAALAKLTLDNNKSSWEEFRRWTKKADVSNISTDDVLDEITDRMDEMDMRTYDGFLDIVYQEEEMLALWEVKIIYSFKLLEIQIKQMLRIGYPEKPSRSFFRWDKIIEFLASKGIDMKSFHGYDEMNQLRMLNNNFKHSDQLDMDVRKIPEFLGRTIFVPCDIERFLVVSKRNLKIFSEAWELRSLMSEMLLNCKILRSKTF